MADAREEGVWTEYAMRDHSVHAPHVPDENSFIYQAIQGYAPGKVLDLGCGSALWRLFFDGYTYVGADQNKAMLDIARKRYPDVTFVQTNGMKLDFEDGEFDLVFTSAVLQHNKHADKALVVQEIARVLKPGGVLICTENTFRKDNMHIQFGHSNWNRDLDDGYSFTPYGWEKFMNKHGFRLEEYSEPSEYVFEKE